MTIEQYIESIIKNNPGFVAEMDRLLASEYAEQNAAARKSVDDRMQAAREKWIENRGEEAYLQNKSDILEHIRSSTPRYSYIKSIELDGDSFDVEIDLLDGVWTLAPVMPKSEDEFFDD